MGDTPFPTNNRSSTPTTTQKTLRTPALSTVKRKNPGGKPSCILGWENVIIRHRYTYYKNERRKRKEIGTGGREGRMTDEKNTSLFWETTACLKITSINFNRGTKIITILKLVCNDRSISSIS